MEETTYLMEAANGMLVRIPESQLARWEAAQERIRRGEWTPDPETQKAIREIISSSGRKE